MWRLVIGFYLISAGTVAQTTEWVIYDYYPDGKTQRRYSAVVVSVVDSFLTEDPDTGEMLGITVPHLSVCPDGFIEVFEPDGFMLYRGTMKYTYAISIRSGKWVCYNRDGTTKEVIYDSEWDYFEMDPNCRAIEPTR
jgi:hypothetical protein